MRLTLRNLLAYLHGAAAAEHLAAIEALVQKTPRIQPLIDRCRQLSARPLPAPALDQTAALHQAETVAMYLDFTLPDEQVGAFEKVVLASDELLAEIIACHKVLADVVTQRAVVQINVNRDRILQLAATHVVTPVLPAREVAAQQTAFVVANQEAMHDSGDLTNYLDGEDDGEVLSLDAAEERARLAEQRAAQEAATSYSSGAAGQTATATRMAPYGARDPFKTAASKVPEALLKREKPSQMPKIAGIAGGGVLVIGALIWMASGMFSGPSGKTKPRGPFVYGVEESSGPTCMLIGKIQYQPEGASPSADAGALVLAWPVNATSEKRLSRAEILDGIRAQRQNPYNLNLVIAKADDDGNFRMRLLDASEYNVVTISQRATTDTPKTWGEAIDAMQQQIEDPVPLIGQKTYKFERLTMPSEKRATLDHTFTN
jgi:hypothetical protein